MAVLRGHFWRYGEFCGVIRYARAAMTPYHLRLTRVEPITVSLAAFSCLSCVYSCKAAVFQVMRQVRTENYYLSGVTGSTLVSLKVSITINILNVLSGWCINAIFI